MNFFKKPSSSFIAYGTLGQPVFTPKHYETLAEEGYHKNVIVYRCVTLIARGIASIPWVLYEHKADIDHEVIHHPLLTLLNRPSLGVSGAAFKESLVSHLLLSGNAYVHMVGPETPKSLQSLRPNKVKIIAGKGGNVKGYEVDVEGDKQRFLVDPLDGYSRILHLKTFHPLHDFYGMSPLEAASSSIDQHNAVGGHNLALLQNGGRPSGAFVFKGVRLSEEQRASLKHDIQRAHEGQKNAGRILMLEGDVEWKDLGLSPKDMDFETGRNGSARDIAQAFGVPPMLVGVPGDATYANYKEARYHLWEDTILPLFDLIVSEFNASLIPYFSHTLKLGYDFDRILALSSRREALWSQMMQASFLSDNEKREALGYSPLR